MNVAALGALSHDLRPELRWGILRAEACLCTLRDLREQLYTFYVLAQVPLC